MASQIEQIRAGQLATQTWESTAFPLLVEAVRINFPLCNKYFFFLQMAPGNAELVEYGCGGRQ